MTADNYHETEKDQGMRQVLTLAFALAILQVGFGIVTPIFPYYVVELGARAIDLGILAASFALTRIFLAGPMGQLSDRTGRKPILMFSLIGFAVANVVYAFAQDITVMIAARAVEGAVSAGFYPSANAYVSDVTTPENRGTAMGYISMGNMLGFVIGPTIGGVLAEFLGIRIPFIIAAIGTLATFLAIVVFVTEPERTSSRLEENEVVRPPIIDVLRTNTKGYSALGLSMFANMFALGILEVAFTLDIVTSYGVSPLEIGAFFGVLGVITIIGNIIFGKLSDRLGRKWLIVIGSFVGALSLYVFMIATDIIGFYIGGAILGVAMSMRGPTIQALTADLTDTRSYGTIMGMMGAISNSAYVVGPLLGGVLYDQSGSAYEALAVAVIVSSIGGIGAIIGLPRKVERSRSRR
ncbi:MAG: MFS transporter [Candidatus Thorarchaeota archaeon]